MINEIINATMKMSSLLVCRIFKIHISNMECKAFHITNIYVNGYALQIWQLQNVLFLNKVNAFTVLHHKQQHNYSPSNSPSTAIHLITIGIHLHMLKLYITIAIHLRHIRDTFIDSATFP